MLTTNGLINWNSLISELKLIQGSIRHIDQTIDEEKTNLTRYDDIIELGLIPYEYARPAFVEMVKSYYEQKLNFSKITFQNYYPELPKYFPGTHFSKDIVDKIEILLNLKVQECWISCVSPHCTIPYHKDEFDKETTWIEKENKKLDRYVIFIDEPIKNQTFILGDSRYENVKQHTVIKWATTKELHSLVNNSNESNFLFHFLGYQR